MVESVNCNKAFALAFSSRREDGALRVFSQLIEDALLRDDEVCSARGFLDSLYSMIDERVSERPESIEKAELLKSALSRFWDCIMSIRSGDNFSELPLHDARLRLNDAGDAFSASLMQSVALRPEAGISGSSSYEADVSKDALWDLFLRSVAEKSMQYAEEYARLHDGRELRRFCLGPILLEVATSNVRFRQLRTMDVPTESAIRAAANRQLKKCGGACGVSGVASIEDFVRKFIKASASPGVRSRSLRPVGKRTHNGMR